MRKFNWLMAALMVFSLSFAACNNDTPEPTPGPEPGPGPDVTDLQLTVSLGETTLTSVTYSVTPSDLEADYFVVAHSAAAVEQCDNDAEIIESIYANIKTTAENNGKSFESFMAEKVKRGEIKDGVIEGLASDVNYYLLVFGVDAEKNYAATTEIVMFRFKTKAPELNECTFTIGVNAHLTNAAIKVTPSDLEQLWTVINIDEETYESYTDEEGKYGWSRNEFIQNYTKSAMDELKKEGLSDDAIATKLFHTGVKTLNAGDLKPSTKYIAFAAGVEIDGENIWVKTRVSETHYKSGEAASSDLTFDIEVTNIEHYAADIRITPSDPNAEYYYYISYIDSKKKSMKPIEIATSAITEYIYYFENMELKRHEPSKGVIDLTGDNKKELNIAETEYYIVAFSFEPNANYGTLIDEETGEYDTNPGTITSAPVYVSFMTGEQGDPMTAEFTFSASEVGPYDFTLEIDAEDPTIYYQPGIAYAENFNPQDAIAQSSTLLAQVMQMCMEGQSPSLTIQEALEEKCSHLYRNGDGKYYIANLEPEREYIGYVLAIDTEEGVFARCVYSDVIATTTAPGTVTPKLELLGVYDGSDENGEIFGNANQTAGSAIVAVKLTETEGASALYAALAADPYEDVEPLSDRYIIANFRGYWQEVNLTVPYHFFLADWDANQTVVAYAQDANGHENGVARMAVKPTTAGDINELKSYVDAVNAATPKAAMQSLVISEDSTPAIECIWSENVGAPRAAQVVHHEVEPITAVESDLVVVKDIQGLRF